MPGVKSIEKYGNEEAVNTLIYIRQAHRLEGINLNTFPELKNLVEKVQGDIREITGYLNSTYGLKDIYMEGLTLEDIKTISSVPQVLRTVEETIGELRKVYGEFDKTKLGEAFEAYQRLRTQASDLTNHVNGMLGGVADLFLSEKANIKPSETRKSNESASELMDYTVNLFNGGIHDSKKFKDIAERAMGGREEATMNLIGADVFKQGHPEIRNPVLIYGGSHDFKDDVEKWNRDNYKSGINLIVITPSSYSDK